MQVEIPLVGEGTDGESNAALATLREEIIPSTLGTVSGIEYAVTGDTAASKDWNEAMKSAVPIVFAFVLAFAFLLLLVSYHVFILSRIREYYDRGLSTEEAVSRGIKSTAGVVTSAAAVMVLVFGVFALMPIIDMKEMGIGLAAAIFIDATIVRGVLLPATMKLLGRWNWYLPRWLEWLPRLEHERSTDPVPQQAAA
jgi:uncharacterized membrane protein YdfJ with MMPL/SSD domain